MKTKRAIGVALLMALVASVSFWLGYQQGSRSSPTRLNAVSNLRQIGLAYRSDHNSIARFSATSDVVATNTQTKGR